MNNFDKKDYKVLKKFAKIAGVSLATGDLTGHREEYNGIAVAFQPILHTEEGRMLAVAVSYCAAEDKFKKKVGKYQALLKFEAGQYIQLPLADYFRKHGKEVTGDLLLSIFSVA